MENYATLPEHPAPGLKIHPTELKAQERRYLVNNDPFKGYIKESEPDKWEKGYAWHTAIGLQAVDGLKTSEYLIHTAVRNIEGEISFEEANALLQSYYEENPSRDTDDRTEEADKVSARIAALLSEKAFSFTPNEYLSIHRRYNGLAI